MKNIVILLKKAILPAFVIFSLLLSTSCSKEGPSAAELSGIAADTLGGIPQCRIYSAKSGQLEGAYLTEDVFSFIYTGKKGHCKEFSALSDYFMLFSTGISVFELHFLRAADITDVPALEKLVGRRASVLNRYGESSRDLDLLFTSPNTAETAVFGHWVILSVTPNNSAVFDAVKAALNG